MAPRAGQQHGGLQQGRGDVQPRKNKHRGAVVEHFLLLGLIKISLLMLDPPNAMNIFIGVFNKLILW
jgi:hypothetical protein